MIEFNKIMHNNYDPFYQTFTKNYETGIWNRDRTLKLFTKRPKLNPRKKLFPHRVVEYEDLIIGEQNISAIRTIIR